MERDAELRRAGWRLIRSSIAENRRWLYVGMGFGLLWTAAKITVPLLAAAAIDDGITKHDGGKITKYAVLLVVVGLIQAIGTMFRRYGAFKLAFRTETNVRARLFAHLQRLHFAFHDVSQTGELMARANTDIFQINMFCGIMPLTTANVFVLVGVVVVMMIKSWSLALVALASLPFLNIAAMRFARRVSPVSLQLQERLGDLSGVVEESISGIRAVKGFGAERLQVKDLDRQADRVLDRALVSARLRAGFLPLVDFLPALSLVAILWYGGHQVLDHQLAIGDLVAFNSYVFMLIWPLRMAAMLVAQASRAAVSAGRVHEILATAPAIVDPPHPVNLAPRGTGEIRFEGVRFRYGDGPLVLDGLDLTIRGGEAVAIVGPTAAGKTTIARLVPRLYDVDEGRVLIDGTDVRALRLTNLRRKVGIVFEDTFLFSETVRENIAFADPEASMDQIRRAARLAGAADFIDELPDGYDTLIGEHGYSLSGGQRQRVAIARAVLGEPRVLILDDATSSVDPTKEHEIRSALREVMADRTTLIIAHRPATIALADRVVLLDEGRIVADGTHAGLLATCERYRAVLAQAAAETAGAETAELAEELAS